MPENATTLTCAFCGASLRVGGTSQPRGAIEADGTIRDRTTGHGLFRGSMPGGWDVTATSLQRTSTLSRPYLPSVELRTPEGAILQIGQGDAGTRRSAGAGMIDAMYGQAAAPYDTSNYAEMPSPIAVADSRATLLATSLGASDLHFSGMVEGLDPTGAQRRASAHYTAEARAAAVMVSSFLGAQVLRTYSLTVGGRPWKMAVFVEAWGAKGGLAGIGASVEGVTERLGGMLGGLASQAGMAAPAGQQPAHTQDASRAQGAGGLLRSAFEFGMAGGLIGKKMRESRAAQQARQQAEPPAAPVPSPQPTEAPAPQPSPARAADASWCVPDFAAFNQGGTVYWSIDRIATLVAPAERFATLLEDDLRAVIDGVFVHPDVIGLAHADQQQTNAAIQANTQAALARSQAQFAAQQAAHRQQQAAFNSYNDSISAARDARQTAFRTATNAPFASASGTGPADFSEAIRGVNTFVTSDGREVELSVQADVAYENQAGEVIGGSAGFDPGADWTQIPRQ